MVNNIYQYIKIIAPVLLIIIGCQYYEPLAAQIFEDAETVWDDNIIVRPDNKSATKAIFLSTLFPGGGHLYANRRSVGTYLFPIIEIGLWTGFFYYKRKGDEIERDYMAYADKYYCRDRFYVARDNIVAYSKNFPRNIYTDKHFRLDGTNTQHFYEDIGKYDKYIFGWQDWYEAYVHPDTGEIQWHFNSEGLWLGNWRYDSDRTEPYDEPYSEMRNTYIQMRINAQDYYNMSYTMSMGFAFNRILSSADAVRVTRKYNMEARYSYNFNMNITPLHTGNITPTINLTLLY